jgi:hypothetical protein
MAEKPFFPAISILSDSAANSASWLEPTVCNNLREQTQAAFLNRLNTKSLQFEGFFDHSLNEHEFLPGRKDVANTLTT